MSICIACGALGGRNGEPCGPCLATLAPAPEVRLASGLVVRGAFLHAGAARRLVHRLKYGGLPGAAHVLGRALAALVPSDATALVPVPRAWARRAVHGIDPAVVLAREISSRCGIPVVAALRAGAWWPRHAGSDRSRRTAPHYRMIRRADFGLVLVDDVLTTGATLEAAAAALGGIVSRGLTATVASRVGGGPPARPSGLLETAWRHNRGCGGDESPECRLPCETLPRSSRQWFVT